MAVITVTVVTVSVVTVSVVTVSVIAVPVATVAIAGIVTTGTRIMRSSWVAVRRIRRTIRRCAISVVCRCTVTVVRWIRPGIAMVSAGN